LEEKEIYLLITRYLSKRTSIEENEMLADWITVSEDNERTFEEIKMVWLNVKSSDKRQTNNALLSLKAKMRQNELEVRSGHTLKPHRKWLAIAAAVLLFGICTMTFINRFVALDVPERLQASTRAGEIKTILLHDGTKVSLAPKSILRYPAIFGENHRRVELIGEAYFEVAKNPHRPFSVLTSDMDVKVLGTHFNVNTIRNHGNTTVSLLEGKVAVNIKDDNNEEYILRPGQELSFNRLNKQVFQYDLDSISVLGWMTKTLVFRNEKLSDAALKIEKMYGVKLVFENQATADTRLYAQFKNDALQDVLDIICESGNLTHRSCQNKIYISLQKMR
jgi:transmembrane sensor